MRRWTHPDLITMFEPENGTARFGFSSLNPLFIPLIRVFFEIRPRDSPSSDLTLGFKGFVRFCALNFSQRKRPAVTPERRVGGIR
jgi:hypothetical protein